MLKTLQMPLSSKFKPLQIQFACKHLQEIKMQSNFLNDMTHSDYSFNMPNQHWHCKSVTKERLEGTLSLTKKYSAKCETNHQKFSTISFKFEWENKPPLPSSHICEKHCVLVPPFPFLVSYWQCVATCFITRVQKLTNVQWEDTEVIFFCIFYIFPFF